MSTDGKTPTGSPGRVAGVLLGQMLRVVRESVGLTQHLFAERLGVTEATVQAWETARRPLTSVRAGELHRIRAKLVTAGAPAVTARLFDQALEADLVISELVECEPGELSDAQHPLGMSVHQHSLTNMITWPITGVTPETLQTFRAHTPRRGPAPSHPELPGDARRRFFDHLRWTAEHGGEPLLRRQSVYLLGFDKSEPTRQFLAERQRRALRHVEKTRDVSSWVAVRSSAMALTLNGDRDALHRFVTKGLADERQERANLNYYAYWVGELHDPQADDTFMHTTADTAWGGTRLLAHLLGRLQSQYPHAELVVHSVYALLLSRPHLFAQHPSLRQQAAQRIEEIQADTDLPSSAHRELASLGYAVRLAS